MINDSIPLKQKENIGPYRHHAFDITLILHVYLDWPMTLHRLVK